MTTSGALSPDRKTLEALDRDDPLAVFRSRFHLPKGIFYFDGNSLGPLTRASRERVREVVERQWGESLIRAWNEHGWIDLARRTASRIAPLVGAAEDEIAVADSTSVNLFKLLAAALRLRPGRRVILSETGQFPTDVYMAQGIAELLGEGHEIRMVPTEDLEASLDEQVAVVLLSHVQFKSGELLDMARLTRVAQDQGALTLWDLSHSAGALPVDLDGCEVDLAVGCGYKFLNGGPGAPAYLYVARRHHEAIRSPLQGWFGHRRPFAFELDYEPALGVERFLCGTAPILSLASLDAALELWSEVDLAEVRRKSIQLGDLFLDLVEARCEGMGLGLACPRDGARRGSQVSLTHPEGYAIVQALIARGVIPDFRAPDVLRFGLTPLYLSYAEVWDGVEILRGILDSREWDEPRFQHRLAVT